MPVNTGTTHGGDIVLYQNTGTDVAPVWAPFAHATSHSISHSTSTREIASKTSGKFTNVRPGKHGVSVISISGLATYDGSDYHTLRGLQRAMTLVKFKLSGRPTGDTGFIEVLEAAGDKYDKGSGYLTSVKREAPADGSSTYSAEIACDGDVTTETVAV